MNLEKFWHRTTKSEIDKNIQNEIMEQLESKDDLEIVRDKLSLKKTSDVLTDIDSDGLTPEQRQLADSLLPAFIEKIIPEDERRDCTQEVTFLEIRFTVFETVHDLEELHTIEDLTPMDAPGHPRRERARLDLIPIVKLLKVLKDTNISKEKIDELQSRYVPLSKAVGMINNNKVRH